MPYKKIAPKRKRYGKKRMYKKRGGYRKRNSNNVVGGPNTCKVVEVLTETQLNLNTPYVFVKQGITGARAPAIAQQFGLYRIASVSFTLRPRFDTYSQGIAGVGNNPVSVPTFYWKMNRFGDMPAGFNADSMRALGCKAYRLDDKNVRFGYKPNILVASKDNTGGGVDTNQIKITPWLSTDERPQDNAFTLSTATHYGHAMWIDAVGAGTADGVVCDMDVRVVYEFKNPRIVQESSAQATKPQTLLSI